MELVVCTEDRAPPKPSWHHPDPESRKSWSAIYEAVTTWFCSSHSFNHEDDFSILYDDYKITLKGDEIRYLGPSLRSAASLLDKAFAMLDDLAIDETKESTPGIFVTKGFRLEEFESPFYTLKLSNKGSGVHPTRGTIFCFDVDESQEYYVPSSRISQGLVWYLQKRSL